MNKSKSVITGTAVLALVIGTLKSVVVDDKLPGLKFFFGVGVMYFLLTGLEAVESEIARNIALAISVFLVLRDGGTILDQFLGAGTTGQVTGLPAFPGTAQSPSAPANPATGNNPRGVIITRPVAGNNAVRASSGAIPITPYN